VPHRSLGYKARVPPPLFLSLHSIQHHCVLFYLAIPSNLSDMSASRVLIIPFATRVNQLVAGSAVVVKPNELESALARPAQTKYYQPQSTPAELAATLAYGVIKGHPFMDGNKRTAFVLANEYLHELGETAFMPQGSTNADGNAMALIGNAHNAVAQGTIDQAGLANVYMRALGKRR
jgi:death-on-curing family protein